MNKKDLKDSSDSELIQLYVQHRSESDAALRVLIERYNQQMFDRYLAKVHDKTIASDLVQELWTKVAASLPRYRDEGKFEHYLSKLHSNVRIDTPIIMRTPGRMPKSKSAMTRWLSICLAYLYRRYRLNRELPGCCDTNPNTGSQRDVSNGVIWLN